MRVADDSPRVTHKTEDVEASGKQASVDGAVAAPAGLNVEREFGRAFERFFGKLVSLNDLSHADAPDAKARKLRWSDVGNLIEDFQIPAARAAEFVDLWESTFGSRRFEEIVPRVPDDTRSGVEDEPGHETRPQPEQSAKYSTQLMEFIARHGNLLCLQQEIRRFAHLAGQARTMAQSVLMFSVGALERAVADIERIRLRTHVGAMGTGEREFSLDELIRLGDLDAVIDEAVERRVDALTYGGLETWRSWYKRSFGFDIGDFALDWSRLSEVVQRRHVVAHNDGVASRLYIKRTGRTDVTVGDTLDLPPAYVQVAVDECFVIGVRMLAAAWEKLGSKPEHQQFHMRFRCYDMLVEERWQVARALALDEMRRAAPSTPPYLIAQVNEWLARRGLGEDVDVEIEAWDVSALSTRYVLAKLALLEKYDELRPLLPVAASIDEVGWGALLSWPLFARLRQQTDFPEILAACTSASGELKES